MPLLFGLAVALVPSTAGSSAVAFEELLKPGDHAALGKQLAAYMDARSANKGIDKAQSAVSDEFERIRKKVKGREPLSLTVDLGKALWESFDYDQAKGVRKGKVSTVAVEVPFYGEGFKIEYATYVPAKYNPKQAYPLVLCIPDKGEKPETHLTEQWISGDLRDNALLAACPMPDDYAQWVEAGGPGKAGGVGNLLSVMKEMTRNHAVDFDRVFIAGRGEGVGAATTIASRFPDRFAGVIGRAGDVKDTPCENFKNLPTFFAGGGGGATAFAEKLEKAEYKNCTLKADGTEADIWAWMREHPRTSNPTSIYLLPGNPFPTRAYWLEIPPYDGSGNAYISAAIDRGTNTITIDGEGAGRVTLYFNDLLVDMDKPIKVVCNGAEHIDTVPRNLQTTLDLFFSARSDPGKLYTASKGYDLPTKPKAK
ncbi:MAG: PHB depolymerase family esterase [Planctomycetota bacterium]